MTFADLAARFLADGSPRPYHLDRLKVLLFHYILRQLEPGHEFSRGQIEEIVRTAKTAPAGSQISLSTRLKLGVGYDKVAINAGARPPVVMTVLQLVPGTSVRFGSFRLVYGTYQDQSAESIILPTGAYFVRPARAGDRMNTTAGSKKIQDIFGDAKVPRAQRPGWPVITDSLERILWLPKLMIDPSLKKASNGYQLIAEEV